MSNRIIKICVFVLGILLILEAIILYNLGYSFVIYAITIYLCVIAFHVFPEKDSVTKTYKYTTFKAKYERFKNKKYLIYIDIDNFSIIENTYNIDDINKVIYLIALVIRNNFRKSIIGRKYKDSFVVCTNESDKEKLISTIKTIYSEISEINVVDNLILSCEFGIKAIDNESYEDNEWKATLALKEAKKSLKDYYLFYSEDILDNMKSDKQNLDKLVSTIKNMKPKACYQPIYNLKTNEIIGAEAFVRLEDKGKVVDASDFIDIARKTGYIELIDKYMIREVCSNINDFKNENVDFKKISINLSKESISNPQTIEYLSETMQKNNVTRNDLELEIRAIDPIDTEELSDKIESLSNKYHLVLDGFGTGYSELSSISKYNFKSIKIDESFLENTNNEKNKSVIENIIKLTKELNIDIVAKNIERIDEYNYLKEIEDIKVQGYLFSRPLNKMDFKKIVKGENENKQ